MILFVANEQRSGLRSNPRRLVILQLMRVDVVAQRTALANEHHIHCNCGSLWPDKSQNLSEKLVFIPWHMLRKAGNYLHETTL